MVVNESTVHEPSAQTFRLRSRLASVAAAFLILLVLGGALSVVMIDGWSSALDRRRTSRAALIEINALQIGYSDQDSGAQGYLLTADRRYLTTFDDGTRRVADAYVALSAIEPPLDDFPRTVDAIHAAGDEWLASATRALVAGDAGAMPSSEALAVGRQRYEVLHDRLEATRSRLDVSVQSAEARSQRFERLAVTALVGAFGAGLVFSVVILVLIRRWMLDPLRDLTSAAIAVAQGETAAIPKPRAEELAIVADAVDFLQRSLSQERDSALRALKGLEQSAILALRVRAELANEIGKPPPGWDMHGSLRSAEGIVAGDCIDTGLLDATTMFVVVLDITGHGAAAALNALRAKSLIRMGLKSGLEPGVAIEQVSLDQRAEERSEYLTAFVGLVDLSTGECRYANAGHPPAVLVGPHGTRTLDATGPLLGPFDATWRTDTMKIEHGSTLLVHTDGLTDVRGAGDEWLGEERVVALVQSLAGADPVTVATALETMASDHRVGPQSDDMALVVLQRLPEGSLDPAAPTSDGRSSHDNKASLT